MESEIDTWRGGELKRDGKRLLRGKAATETRGKDSGRDRERESMRERGGSN